MEIFISPSPGCCGILGLLILYSLCQPMENIRRKTFHFLQLKSVLWSFKEMKVCGWDGCSPEACTDCILRCFLRRSGSEHGAPNAELRYNLWTRLSAPCISSCLLFQCCVSSFQELPKWGREFVWLQTGLYEQLGFVLFQISEKQGFLLPVKYQNTDRVQDRNIYQGVVKNLYFLGRKYQSWKPFSILITLFLLY